MNLSFGKPLALSLSLSSSLSLSLSRALSSFLSLSKNPKSRPSCAILPPKTSKKHRSSNSKVHSFTQNGPAQRRDLCKTRAPVVIFSHPHSAQIRMSLLCRSCFASGIASYPANLLQKVTSFLMFRLRNRILPRNLAFSSTLFER